MTTPKKRRSRKKVLTHAQKRAIVASLPEGRVGRRPACFDAYLRPMGEDEAAALVLHLTNVLLSRPKGVRVHTLFVEVWMTKLARNYLPNLPRMTETGQVEGAFFIKKRVSAERLLNWLYDQGLSPYDTKMLLKTEALTDKMLEEYEEIAELYVPSEGVDFLTNVLKNSLTEDVKEVDNGSVETNNMKEK